jgi:hypothetical protein
VKKTLAISVLLLIFILFGCADQSGNTTDTQNNSKINNTNETSISIESSISSSNELTYSSGPDGKILVSGLFDSGVIVSAEVLSGRDLYSPGDAATYQIKAIPFSEYDRTRFIQEGWTLIDDITKQSSIGIAYFDGTGYYDTYSSGLFKSISIITLPEIIHYRTPRGGLFSSLAKSMGDIPIVTEDFDFSSTSDAFLLANTFFSNANFKVSDRYDVYRIPYTWLDQSERLAEYYGEDTSTYKELYPQGFTSEDNAYLFYLFQSIDDLPILRGNIGTLLQNGERPVAGSEIVSYSMNGMEALVTDKGVECAMAFYTYEVGSVSETKNMCSFETALVSVTDAIFSGNLNDDLFSHVGSQTSGTISVVKVELGYLPLLKKDDCIGQAIPCWMFEIVWEDKNSSLAFPVRDQIWAAVNAYTGEYIPATTSPGEI